MASTYSGRLRFELIGNGEQSGSWGTTTNTNLGTLIEQAIAGVSSVTHDDTANYTLTAANGTSDEARNAVLVIGGTLTAARNVVCPTQQKLYLVKNSTADGFAVTIKTSGGTGISVPNGKTMFVFCDGTNVVDAINNLPAGTLIGGAAAMLGSNNLSEIASASTARTNLGLGALAVLDTVSNAVWSGTDLAVANGGTGASTEADARTNLGLGDLAVLDTVSNAEWSGTDLAVLNGGTGASTAGGARTNLGLEVTESLVTLNGDFGSSTVMVARIRNTITVSFARISHSLDTLPESAAGVIPAWARPDLNTRINVYYKTGTDVSQAEVTTTGVFRLNHDAIRSDAGSGGSITYNVGIT